MDSVLKSVLKRQLSYLIGSTITGTVMTYYYGFLFAITVNSIIWFVNFILFNKFYWNYTGFKDGFQIVSKYIGRIRKKKPNNNFATTNNAHEDRRNVSKYTFYSNKDYNKSDNLVSPL